MSDPGSRQLSDDLIILLFGVSFSITLPLTAIKNHAMFVALAPLNPKGQAHVDFAESIDFRCCDVRY